MQQLWSRPLADGRRAQVFMTERSDGDLAPAGEGDALTAPPLAVPAQIPAPWSWLRQVHSDRVCPVEQAGQQRGAIGDALVSTVTDATLSIRVADCVPVAFVADGGAVGVAHAGWRGLMQGVLESTHRAVRSLAGRGEMAAIIGPSICAACYEFGEPDLSRLAQRFGPSVRSVTSAGTPAADLRAVVATELERLGIEDTTWSDACTACDADRYWSYRARREMQRQAMLVWLAGGEPTQDAE